LRKPHYAPGEFENGPFTLKTHQIFFPAVRQMNFKTQKSPGILDVFEKTLAGKSYDYREAIFSKTSVFKVFSV